MTFSFAPGAASAGAGFTVINTFNTTAGITGSGFQINTPPANSSGSPPANSIPSGTPYLSVLGGGAATITFASPVTAFQFDWGSIDYYNRLIVDWSTGEQTVIPGTTFINAANGNRTSPGTNGLFTIQGTAGETFQSFTVASGRNSFEIDNLAIASGGGAVPEPATWAMMIMGFGGVGAMMRRRRMIPQAV